MKQTVLAIMLAAGIAGASAAPVSRERAATTATDFARTFAGQTVAVKNVLSVKDSYYVVNLKPQGWVIVAADDNTEPIIGKSDTGYLDPSTMNSDAAFFMGEVSKNVRLKAATGRPLTHMWNNVADRYASRADDGTVAPLIKVNMNQTSPFNKYCPGSGANKAIVGCVAVAMAQAMSVQQWPDCPVGQKSYASANYGNISVDFDSEKPYDWANLAANRYDEAARLLYHAGVSVEMGYGPEASGVLTSRMGLVVTALKTYFSYGSDVKITLMNSISGSTDQKYETWERMIYNELSAGRAVVYNAISRGSTATHAGHSFNIDGYSGNKLYHVNWGWGGNSNGDFRLNALNMDDYQYNYDQSIITGIGSPERVLRSIELNYTTIDENLPAGTVVGLITVNGEAPKSDYTLDVRGAYAGTGFPRVPFEVKGDRLVTTETLSSSKGNYSIEIVATAGNDRLTAGFEIDVVKARTVAEATSLKFDRTTGEFTVTCKHGATITVSNAEGTAVFTESFDPVPVKTFNRSLLSKGTNRIVLRAGSDEKTIEIKN